jgi:receptor expression-enhancing protein 1/2/3/4
MDLDSASTGFCHRRPFADESCSIPFYFLFKLIFFLWLSLPQTEGSTYLFNALLAPMFHEHERDIDAFLSSLKSRVSGALLNVLNWAWARAKQALDVSASVSKQGIVLISATKCS